ncbi:hypothetical protein LI328DRAFT_138974 [Trichoderma asperelloides]|nr:hypothetical protein LI328DRAFT_138974 [Trichoderma asperelloides]
MRRVWGQSKWRHGLGCPNQMNEEQGVPGNDNRTRGERERESVLGNGLRWAKRAKKKKKKKSASPHLTACLIALLQCSGDAPEDWRSIYCI